MEIKMKADESVCLSFYGPIDDGFLAEDKSFDEAKVLNMFKSVPPKANLDILLNSPGGSVDSALAINGILNRHQGAITIHVTGLAASAATLITSLKNAKTVISRGSLMMIHNPLTAVMGNADDLTKQAEVLDKCAASMRQIYKDKTGLSESRIQTLMDDETWLTADEAVELGFADEIDESEPVTAQIKGDHILAIAGRQWDLGSIADSLKEKMMQKKTEEQTPAKELKKESAVKPQALTIERLRAEAPELLKSIVAETIKTERVRIQSLMEIDNGANHDLVLKAMFEEPRTAEQVAIETIKAQKAQAEQSVSAMTADAEAVADVLKGADGAEGALPDRFAERDALIKAVQENLKQINGYK